MMMMIIITIIQSARQVDYARKLMMMIIIITIIQSAKQFDYARKLMMLIIITIIQSRLIMLAN